MWLLPSVQARFNSPLSKTELLQRIQANTTNRIFEWTDKPFRGQIADSSFELHRIRWFNNVSNRPRITGTVEPLLNGEGSELKLRIWLYPVGFWFGAFIVLLISLVAMLIVVEPVRSSSMSPLAIFIPFGILGFGLASVLGPFWVEVKSLRLLLTKLLLLTEITPA
ncbi:hypothetical protein ACFQ48_15520 [Hymenobacter caeli]|uniref:Uncharacterized protein n=1 Tax=Hymenobacter caeli TaxID=2735894 RepID=A0ABX2FRA7_9BACT|nr:hypothetical protein [Hymenobacter caeli]NRT19477.1 hypothetical protein [Hymenobacter caeli]